MKVLDHEVIWLYLWNTRYFLKKYIYLKFRDIILSLF